MSYGQFLILVIMRLLSSASSCSSGISTIGSMDWLLGTVAACFLRSSQCLQSPRQYLSRLLSWLQLLSPSFSWLSAILVFSTWLYWMVSLSSSRITRSRSFQKVQSLSLAWHSMTFTLQISSWLSFFPSAQILVLSCAIALTPLSSRSRFFRFLYSTSASLERLYLYMASLQLRNILQISAQQNSTWQVSAWTEFSSGASCSLLAQISLKRKLAWSMFLSAFSLFSSTAQTMPRLHLILATTSAFSPEVMRNMSADSSNFSLARSMSFILRQRMAKQLSELARSLWWFLQSLTMKLWQESSRSSASLQRSRKVQVRPSCSSILQRWWKRSNCFLLRISRSISSAFSRHFSAQEYSPMSRQAIPIVQSVLVMMVCLSLSRKGLIFICSRSRSMDSCESLRERWHWAMSMTVFMGRGSQSPQQCDSVTSYFCRQLMALLVELMVWETFSISASMWQVLGISLSWEEDSLMLISDCYNLFRYFFLLALKSSLLRQIYTLRISISDLSQLFSSIRLDSYASVSLYFRQSYQRSTWSGPSRNSEILAISWNTSVFSMQTFLWSWKETSFSLIFSRMLSASLSASFSSSIIALQSCSDSLRQASCIFTQNWPKAISKSQPFACLNASSIARLASKSLSSASSNWSKLWPAAEYFLVMSITLMISFLSAVTARLIVLRSVSRNIICSSAFAGSPFKINASDFFIIRSTISSYRFWLLAQIILAQQQSTLFWAWLLLRNTCPRSCRLSFSPMSSLYVQQASLSLRLSSSGLPFASTLKMVPYLRTKQSNPSLLSLPMTLKMLSVLNSTSFSSNREMSTRFTKPQSFSSTGELGSTGSSKTISRMRLCFLSLANFWATASSSVVETNPWISMQLPMQASRYLHSESERSAPLQRRRSLRDLEQGNCCLQMFLMAWNILLKGSPMMQNSSVVLAMRSVLLRHLQKKESSVQKRRISRSLKGQVRQNFMCSLSFWLEYIFSHCSMKRRLEVSMSTLLRCRLARQQMLLRQVMRSALSLSFSRMKLGSRTFSSFSLSPTTRTFSMSSITACSTSSQLSSTLRILWLNLLLRTCRTTSMLSRVTTFTKMHRASPTISQKCSMADQSIATLHWYSASHSFTSLSSVQMGTRSKLLKGCLSLSQRSTISYMSMRLMRRWKMTHRQVSLWKMRRKKLSLGRSMASDSFTAYSRRSRLLERLRFLLTGIVLGRKINLSCLDIMIIQTTIITSLPLRQHRLQLLDELAHRSSLPHFLRLLGRLEGLFQLAQPPQPSRVVEPVQLVGLQRHQLLDNSAGELGERGHKGRAVYQQQGLHVLPRCVEAHGLNLADLLLGVLLAPGLGDLDYVLVGQRCFRVLLLLEQGAPLFPALRVYGPLHFHLLRVAVLYLIQEDLEVAASPVAAAVLDAGDWLVAQVEPGPFFDLHRHDGSPFGQTGFLAADHLANWVALYDLASVVVDGVGVVGDEGVFDVFADDLVLALLDQVLRY